MTMLEKRTSESKTFDIDCSGLLGPGEVVQSVTSITAEPTTSPALTFGTPQISGGDTEYKDQRTGVEYTVPAGQVVRVRISGGKIPAGRTSQKYTIRLVFASNVDPAIEATVVLLLTDTPTA